MTTKIIETRWQAKCRKCRHIFESQKRKIPEKCPKCGAAYKRGDRVLIVKKMTRRIIPGAP